jgi:hypothetical protein
VQSRTILTSSFFASSYTHNEDYGLVQDWPPERALLLLDSIESGLRQAWLWRAAQHTHTVWILHLHRPSMAAPMDFCTLVSLPARCVTLVPGNSTLLHKPGFWQKAEWDEEKTEHAAAQIWMMGGPVAADRIGAQHSDLSLAALGDWTGRRYDFHWCIDGVPRVLRLYRQHQQGLVPQYEAGWTCDSSESDCPADMAIHSNLCMADGPTTAFQDCDRSIESHS